MSAPAAPGRTNAGFNPIVMAALLVVGLVATVVFLAGQAFDTGPRLNFDGRAHAASKSAVGYAGAVELLKSLGRPVVVARGPTRSPEAVLVVTPEVGAPAGSIFDEPLVAGHEGPVLIILPKWATSIHEDRFNWVRKAGIERTPADVWLRPPGEEDEADPAPERGEKRSPQEAMREAIEKARRDADPDPNRVSLAVGASGPVALYSVRRERTLIGSTGAIDRPRAFAYAPGWEPLIVDGQGRAILIGHPEEPWFVLAEPDLLNTHGLADLANARAGLAILDRLFTPQASYVFDISLHGFERSRSFLREAFEPPFLAATICAIVAVALMGWHAFVRFGAPAREGRAFALGKRALADNQADLIKMTRREHRMGAPYGVVVRDLAARAVGAPRDLTPEGLDELLDRLGEGGRTSWPLSALRQDIEQAQDPAELVRAAERLHHWKLEMTRERQ